MQLQLNVRRKAETTLLHALYNWYTRYKKKNADVKCLRSVHIKHKKINPELQPWGTNSMVSTDIQASLVQMLSKLFFSDLLWLQKPDISHLIP